MSNEEIRDKAFRDYEKGMKYKDIAQKYGVSLSAVKSWASRYWKSCNPENKKLQPKDKKVATKGAPKGNKNAIGNSGGAAPKQNSNAEKHGLFRKYLPKETFSIIEEMPSDPLDVLWDQIQIAYAAIIRAQRIMYVSDKTDKTIEKVAKQNGNVIGEKWEVQQAWDKQANFLKAQARAQGELRSMIKQYDELLHKNWDLATEEQRARIDILKAKVQSSDSAIIEDDGFLEALNGSAAEDWDNEDIADI